VWFAEYWYDQYINVGYGRGAGFPCSVSGKWLTRRCHCRSNLPEKVREKFWQKVSL